MEIEIEFLQKLLLAFVPVILYLFPHFIFPYIYDSHLKNYFLETIGPDFLAAEKIRKLKQRVARDIDFISFVTIFLVTFVSIIYNKEKKSYFWEHSEPFIYVSLFVLFSVINFAINRLTEKPIGKLYIYLEQVLVCYSAYLIIELAA